MGWDTPEKVLSGLAEAVVFFRYAFVRDVILNWIDDKNALNSEGGDFR